jgi:hypothetical protein
MTFIEKDNWTAESKDAEKYAVAHSVEEAVAALWFALRKKKKPVAAPQAFG